LWSKQHPTETQQWAHQAAQEIYHSKVIKLIQPHTGFHFRGTQACLEQLEDFSMVDMGKNIMIIGPFLWDLLGILLDADHTQ